MGRRRPSAIGNQHLKILVKQNRRQSVIEISQMMVISISLLSNELKKIGKLKTFDKWVPHKISESQRVRHFGVSLILRLRNTKVPFLNRLVMRNEPFMAIVNDLLNGLIMTKEPNTFKIQIWTNKRL